MYDPNLACRLLRASHLAYSITDDGTHFDPSDQVQDEIKKIGFDTSTLRFYQPQSHDGINAFYFGETATEAIISFRGTLPPSDTAGGDFFKIVFDWLNDGKIDLVKGKNLAGKVHKGFLESIDALWAGICDLDLAGLQTRNKSLLITGHSKGGSLAYLAAYRLARLGIPVKAVYTYAAARAGDKIFAEAFDQTVANVCRFEYKDDLVPHLPPETGAWLNVLKGLHSIHDTVPSLAPHLEIESSIAHDVEKLISRLEELAATATTYASVGELRFINWSDAIVGNSMALRWERNLHLAERIAELKLKEIAEDHSSSGGYMTSVCKS